MAAGGIPLGSFAALRKTEVGRSSDGVGRPAPQHPPNKKPAPVRARDFLKNARWGNPRRVKNEGQRERYFFFLAFFLAAFFLAMTKYPKKFARLHEQSSARHRPVSSASSRRYFAAPVKSFSSDSARQRQRQLPAATPGVLKRASAPRASRSCSGTTARRAGLA